MPVPSQGHYGSKVPAVTVTVLLFAVNIVLTTIPCLVNTEGLMLK